MTYRDPEFLKRHIRDIVAFYHPACVDTERGGYINQMLDDGTIYDRDTKHLVGTCRFIFNYAAATLLFDDVAYQEAAAHDVRFLQDHHRQPDGGYAWLLSGLDVVDGTRHCYGQAFVLLAAAAAAKAGAAGARQLTGDAFALLEERFWDPSSQLHVDEIGSGDWRDIDPYRGQNANMHMCEAMLLAWEATGDRRFLDRAHGLAHRVCVDLAGQTDGLIWEHYKTDWAPDWSYNRDDPKNLFRPCWVLAETIAAAASLALRTGDDRYWDWYDRAWAYSDTHFVDHQYGGWYRILNAEGQRYDYKKSPPGKTGYHPLSACDEVLQAMRHATKAAKATP